MIRARFPKWTVPEVSAPLLLRKVSIRDATRTAGPVVEVHVPESDQFRFANRSQQASLRTKRDTLDRFLLRAKSSEQFMGLDVPKPDITILTPGRQHLSLPAEVYACHRFRVTVHLRREFLSTPEVPDAHRFLLGARRQKRPAWMETHSRR